MMILHEKLGLWRVQEHGNEEKSGPKLHQPVQ